MDAGIKIRKPAPADIGSVADIENACFGSERFSRRQLSYLAFRARGMFLVAEAGGTVAGYISCLAHSRRANLRIYALAVAPGFRGRDIAGTLIGKSKEYAAHAGLRRLTLEVRTGNAAAIALYRKHGFESSSVRKGYYADGADAFVMVCGVV